MSTSIEDNELPKAILTRIMKQVLPDNTNIQGNAKLAMTKSTTLFINYLASAANDVAADAGHKIISGAHVLKALESLDLEDMVPRLTEELKAFQAIQKSRKEGASKSSKEKDESVTAAGSKKRKPLTDDPSSTVKARKSSTNATPRDGQESLGDQSVDQEDMDEDEREERIGDEDEGQDEEDEEVTVKDPEGESLNMDEPEEEDKASNMGDEDDSDGF
ncbi:hypothetical protein BG011_006349 [Mortierella polycephala]|uniref:DNA polymerase epsilon subunit D n=1 Tax=Mortierella polycephala TaxID=41804 RepID=A0A9P6PWI6_9FUNG|nr:hypothetical protein BG011_006349 [Mortierella polycephala]